MRFRALLFSVFISVFVFSDMLHAQIISGSVRDSVDNPVGGAVRLYDAAGDPVENFWIDPSGNYQSWPLANGIYYAVTVFTHEVLDEAWDDISCENLICTITSSTPIEVSGSDITGIDFVLEPILVGGHISGFIEDNINTPLPDVGIDFRNSNGEHLFGIASEQDGTYQTPLLANDIYYLHTVTEPFGLGRELYDNQPCQPPDICGDHAFVVTNGTAVEITGSDIGDINFELELPAGAMISGQLTDAGAGIVVPDVHMNLLGEFNEYLANTNTDSLGNYYFSGLADGTYKVYAVGVHEGYTGELYGGDHCQDWSCDLNTSGTPIVISGGTSTPGKDIELDFTGTRLLGTITRSDTGAPVSSHEGHIGVDFFKESGDFLITLGTNRAGQYQIILPGTGNYYLAATNDWEVHSLVNEVWEDISCIVDCYPPNVGGSLVNVPDGSTVVADFVLVPGFRLSGTIRTEGVLTGEGRVKIWDESGSLLLEAWNDGSGNWETPPIPAGTYYATVQGEDFGMVSQLFNVISCPQEFCDVTTGTPIVLTDSDRSDIHFDLVPFSEDWSISGSVKDGDNNPVGGGVRFYDPFGGHLFDVGIDPHGNFQTHLVANGTYFALTVNTHEMLDEAWDNIPCENVVCNIPDSTPIVVSGADVTGINFVLEPILTGGRISGRVTDMSTSAVPDVGLAIRNRHGEFLVNLFTDSNGNYETPLLASDSYYVHTFDEPLGLGRELYDGHPCLPVVMCDDWGYVTTHGTPVVIDDSDRMNINFELMMPPGAMISGQLTDTETGLVIPEVHMNLLGEANEFVANFNTDSLGNYYFSGLEDGTYKVYAVGVPEGYTGELYGGDHCQDWNCDLNTVGTPVVISSGVSAPGKDIALDFSGTRLLGTITRSDTGVPVSSHEGHIGVDFFNETGDYLTTWGTNRAGQYQVVLPGSGSFFLAATNDWGAHSLVNEVWEDIPCFFDCYPPNVGGSLVHVPDGSTVVADFVLVPGFRLSGTIRTEGVLTGDGGVKIWDGSGSLLLEVGNDGSGNWETPPIPAGTYYATIRGEDFGMVSQLFSGIPCPQEFCDVTSGTPIVLTDSDRSDIHFDLNPFTADWTISGSVKDSGGNPLEGSVWFFDPVGNRILIETIDESGSFMTPTLPDGTYFVMTRTIGAYLDEAWGALPCENRICDVTASTPVVVSGSDVTGIDYVLDPITQGGHISGIIEDSSHVPLADVNIIIRNAVGGWLYRVTTGPDGVYQSPLLANDTYFLHTRDEPFGLGQEMYDDIPCQPHGGCGDAAYIAATATPVIVEGADQGGIDFMLEMPPGGLITGKLIDFDTGMPLPDIHLVILDAFHNQVDATNSDVFGDYYFSELDDGEYKVYADGVPEGYTAELYGGDHCPDWSCDLDISGTAITVSGGATVGGKDIVLDFEGTRLLGTVTRSDNGLPVSSQYGHAGVDLFNATGAFIETWGTNRAGQYQIVLPGAGDYYLSATVDWHFHQLINELWDDIKCYDHCDQVSLGATLIPVTAETTVVADFQLEPEVIFNSGFEN